MVSFFFYFCKKAANTKKIATFALQNALLS